jgi:hypothetical protein
MQLSKDEWYEMDLTALPQGVYLIRAESEQVRGIVKLVKL